MKAITIDYVWLGHIGYFGHFCQAKLQFSAQLIAELALFLGTHETL